MDDTKDFNRDNLGPTGVSRRSYTLDHIAVVSKDIKQSVVWHEEQLGASLLYEDETWALVRLSDGTKVAFVTGDQHPPHVGLRSSAPEPPGLVQHRDGSRSTYCRDPHSGAVYEWIWYPAMGDRVL